MYNKIKIFLYAKQRLRQRKDKKKNLFFEFDDVARQRFFS